MWNCRGLRDQCPHLDYNLPMKPCVVVYCAVLLAGCGTSSSSGDRSQAQEFLHMYNEVDQRLNTTVAEAAWRATTDVSEQYTGERVGAETTQAAFRGSRYVIESSRKFLSGRQALNDLQFRQLDRILLSAAESPGTIPEIVRARIQAEAQLAATLDGFRFCLEPRGAQCAKPTNPNEIDEKLLRSRDLAERRRFWEVSKQTGPALKPGLAQLRDLRNRVASELGYSSYFHLQVADYGMSVVEMLQLMDRILQEMRPLYEQLHLWTRRKLAARYGEKVPERIPAHWLGNRWGQQWPALVESVDLDPLFRGKSGEWIVRQAERFYTSLGMAPLPKSFWAKSDLYELPPGATRKKNTHASAWHVDMEQDVRSLMSVIPNYYWFETSHHELGHVYYFLAYSRPQVPHVLREGLNRAFHEALGDLISIAARQEPYLRQTGLLAPERSLDQLHYLLSEALDSAVVFLPWSAGTMTHFEYEIYEKKLPADHFNRRWWELVRQYQGIDPPAARGEEFCDACTKTHIIDDPAQYYDYAMAYLMKYQLHDHIARRILRQDPRRCNYYGNREVGRWLNEVLSLGATRDWRQVIREKTGEELSTRAMREYFRPLVEFLQRENGR